MSFGEPILLFGLVLVPLAALVYASMQARKRREAAAFANPALMPNLVTARPGLRRHLPPLLLLLALAAMIVALARPQRTVASPERAATVMMVTDISGSMNATDVEPNRLAAAVKSANRLTDELPRRSGSASSRSRTSPSSARRRRPTALRCAGARPADRGRRHRDGPRARARPRGGATPVPDETGTGTRALPRCSSCSPTARTPRAASARSRSPAARPAAHIPIYAIALGTPDGEVEVQDSFGHHRRDPGPAGHGDAQGDRPRQPRQASSRPPTPPSCRRSTRASARDCPPSRSRRRSPWPSPAARSCSCSPAARSRSPGSGARSSRGVRPAP